MDFIVVLLMALAATWLVRRNRTRRLADPRGQTGPARLLDPRALSGTDGGETLIERKARLERELDEIEARRNEKRSELLSVRNRIAEPDDGPPHR